VTEDQLQLLQSKLWAVADILRGRMDPDDYRDYMLGFIFYKYLSERMELFANEALKDTDLKFADLNSNTPEDRKYIEALRYAAIGESHISGDLGYFLAPSELFGAVAKRGRNKASENELILDDLRKVFKRIEDSTQGTTAEDDFNELFEDIDLSNSRLGRTPNARNELIVRIMTTLEGIDFQLQEADGDILGDAYEYLIAKFAGMAGKKAGEFYTPQQVSTILTRIVASDHANGVPQSKKRIKSVYDPTCGSGSLLLRFEREGIEIGQYFGQEMNRTTFNLARMNMILHDIHHTAFDLRQDDTIEHPAEEHKALKFEAVVANPPFSAKWSQHDLFSGDERFSDYGVLPPDSKADYCFILHMLHHLADDGVMAVILPHGALFRGNAEGKIRTQLIKDKNWLDAVIGLPANVFYGTSIPACIMVFRKCREASDDILFIDASQHFEKVKNRNVLKDADVARVVEAYRTREEQDRFARPVPLAEIAANDFNLNIPRYVDTSEPEEEIDLEAVAAELEAIEAELASNAEEIKRFCDELGIKAPV